MKSNEELNTIKEEVENANKQRRMLTEEETAHVTGGADSNIDDTDASNDPSGIRPMPTTGWFGIPRSE